MFIRMTVGRDAGKEKEFHYEQARDLIAKGHAVKVDFDAQDAQPQLLTPPRAASSTEAPRPLIRKAGSKRRH
jgi:hypothetical protein